MPMRSLQVLVVVAVMYVAAQMLADITALRILSVAGLSVSGGTLIYPITFTLRDLVHKVSTAGIARILIFASAAINLFMALLFWLVAELPADLAVGEQAEFGMVLGARIPHHHRFDCRRGHLRVDRHRDVRGLGAALRPALAVGKGAGEQCRQRAGGYRALHRAGFLGRAAHRGDAELVPVEYPGQVGGDLCLDPGHLSGQGAAEGVVGGGLSRPDLRMRADLGKDMCGFCHSIRHFCNGSIP